MILESRFPCNWTICLLSALLTFSQTADADLKREVPGIPAPPPLAIPLDVEVYRGESVSIPLMARGRAAADAKFLLRSRPFLGSLGEVRQIRPGQASVEYLHGDGPAPAVDEFTFAVQSPGSPVSAPARVRISILLPPAELLPPEPQDFGEVLVGNERMTFLTLANVGGEPLQTRITAGEEWGFPEGNAYVIGGGEVLQVPVVFRPNEDREFTGTVRFSHDPKLVVALRGRGVEPLRWNPLSIALPQGGAEANSPQFLELENRTREELRGKVETDPGVVLADRIAIPPGGTLRLPVSAAEGFVAGAKGTIRIVHQHGVAEVPFQLFPAPANVVILPNEEINFGEVAARQSVERTLVFENTGGLPTAVSLTPPSGIETEAAMDFQLPPRARTEIPLVFQSRRPGAWSSTLEIRAGAEARMLRLRATVLDAAPGDNPVFVSPASRESAPTAASAEAEDEKEVTQDVPLLTWNELKIVSQTPTSVVLEWETDISPDRAIEIEQRSIGVDETGNVEVTWQPTANADIDRSGERLVRATIFRLEPAMRLNLRHSVKDESGELRGTSEMLVVETPMPERAWSIPWGWLLAALLVAFVIWRAKKRQLAEQLATEEEIRRLEQTR